MNAWFVVKTVLRGEQSLARPMAALVVLGAIDVAGNVLAGSTLDWLLPVMAIALLTAMLDGSSQ